MLDKKFLESYLIEEDADRKLCQLAKKMRKELPSARAVYDTFLRFVKTLPDEELYGFKWDPVLEVMDKISGRCCPSSALFPDEVV